MFFGYSSKVRLEPQVKSNPAFLEKYPQHAILEQSYRQQVISRQQQQEQIKIIDALLSWSIAIYRIRS
jgi:hypothetical protein